MMLQPMAATMAFHHHRAAACSWGHRARRAYSSSAPHAACIAELQTLLPPEILSKNPSVLAAHGKDEAYFQATPPDAVLFARSTEDVATALRTCSAHGMPVIPFGTGTSLEGHIAAIHGGLSIDCGGMDTILEVNQEDMDCRVEAGVKRLSLNEHLRDTGLFFPIDPGADASLGGMAATRASGTNAVRYGTLRENVLGMQAVLASGEVIQTGGRARKSSAGYDLTRLFVGSEGTLGVITELQLKLHAQPAAVASAVCSFPTVADAVDTVTALVQSAVPVARAELLDKTTMAAVNAYANLSYAETPALFLEFHGSDAAVKEQSEEAGKWAQEFNGMGFAWASALEDRNKLWHARHNAYYASMALRPGCVGWPTDVCVPISRLTECITETIKDLEEANVTAPVFGHVGDGNFHVIMLMHEDDPPAYTKAQKAINQRMIERAIEMGGTSTGEHGVGVGKLPHMLREHGQGAMDVMASIKHALDPAGVMNPGKVIL